MRNINMQKQTFSAQLIEIESAIKELETTSESYKIIGNILVKKDAKSLKQDLIQKKDTTEARINAIEKQEQRFAEKLKKAQSEILKED